MATIQEKFAQQVPGLREEIQKLIKDHGEKVISKVTVAQAYGGMRGVLSLVCDTSLVDPEKGLIIRGFPIVELADRIPEEIFYLLLTGELPDQSGLKSLQDDLKKRLGVPSYVWDIFRAMPADTHPMVMLSTGIMAMERESVFRKRYDEGMKKTDYWVPCLEDSLQLLARLPELAAGLYRIRYKKGALIPPDSDKDWSSNFVHMLGLPDHGNHLSKLMSLYFVLHCDHEGGNVSAFTCHVVGSALSDLYYAVSAGLNGLAGPLHGLANQECLNFVLAIRKKYNGVPSDDELKKYVWDSLNSGQVVPGYGHAVLRYIDPRFVSFHEFGKKACPDDEVFKIVDRLFNLVPDILKEQGKAKNPWPNVDAGSGALLYHFGLTEFDFYTCLFGVSRALGMSAFLTLNRAIGTPITRPKSVLTSWMKEQVTKL